MRDNNQDHFDPDLLNRAWADMQTRLDAEMPTRRRRGLVVWWWPLGLVASAALFLMFSEVLSPVPAARPATVTTSPAATVADPAEDCPPGWPAPAARPAPAPAQAAAPTASPTQPRALAARLVPPADLQPTPGPAFRAPEPLTPSQEKPPVSPATASPANRYAGLLATLPNRPLALAVSATPNTTWPASPNVDRPQQWEWLVEGGLNGRAATPAGLSAAVLVERRLGAHWSANLGLRYQFLRQGMHLPTGRNAADLALESDTLGVSPVVSTEQLLRYVANNPFKSHWLEMPLNLGYRLHPRWEVEGGVYLGYLLAGFAPSGADLTSDGRVLSPIVNSGSFDFSSAPEANWFLDQNERQATIPASERWQMGAAAALRYRLTTRWDLQLAYRTGSGSWASPQPFKLQQGFWQVGARWRLN